MLRIVRKQVAKASGRHHFFSATDSEKHAVDTWVCQVCLKENLTLNWCAVCGRHRETKVKAGTTYSDYILPQAVPLPDTEDEELHPAGRGRLLSPPVVRKDAKDGEKGLEATVPQHRREKDKLSRLYEEMRDIDGFVTPASFLLWHARITDVLTDAQLTQLRGRGCSLDSAELLKAFQEADTDGDGEVSLNDMWAAVSKPQQPGWRFLNCVLDSIEVVLPPTTAPSPPSAGKFSRPCGVTLGVGWVWCDAEQAELPRAEQAEPSWLERNSRLYFCCSAAEQAF